MMRTLVIVVFFFSLSACASLPHGAQTSVCSLEGRELRVSGPTDERMVDCFISADNVETVMITSAGGSVRSAIDIGRRLRSLEAELVIADHCESSCANYLIPAAHRVRILPEARLVLHGSVDAWAVQRGASVSLYDLQRSYAAEMGIPPGWLLMRTAADGLANRHGRFVSGEAEWSAGPDGPRYIVVGPAFLASCLPWLPTTWHEPTYVDDVKASGPRRTRLEHQGFGFSGSMQCSEDQDYPVPDGATPTDRRAALSTVTSR